MGVTRENDIETPPLRVMKNSRKGTRANAALLVPVAWSASESAAFASTQRSKPKLLQCMFLALAVCMLAVFLAPSASTAANVRAPPPTLTESLKMAFLKAWHSGSRGFLAGMGQVIAFMWLRTSMNYQYKNGGSLPATLRILWAEGGIGRLYQGLFPWAILQAPLSRFGDTAANALVLAIAGALFPSLPISFVTAFGSFCGAAWRVVITPVDTCKTTLQTDGQKGWGILKEKVAKGGLPVLWHGWEGNYLANVVGSYPWFVVVNILTYRIPEVDGLWWGLMRHAFIGAVASTVSDVISNSIRVMKTKKQTNANHNISYIGAAKEVIATDGISGLMLRGLDTRIFTNILQGSFFAVLWKGFFKG